MPINHIFVVNSDLARARPFGVEANRKAIEFANAHAVQQKLIPRDFRVDELYADNWRALAS